MNLPANTERAVVQGKTAAAVRSLENFRKRKRDSLAREKRLLSRQLSMAVTETKKHELRKEISKNERTSRELEIACNRSALLRKTEERKASPGDEDGIERRVADCLNVVPVSTVMTTRAIGQSQKLHGYAAVFNSFANFGDIWRETIKPGAFSKALESSDVRALYNHDYNYVLGRSINKTQRLYQTAKGLEYYCDLLEDDSLSAMVSGRIRRGDISGSSFSFSDVEDEWIFSKGQPDTRVILSIGKLYDVGPVTYPAYQDTFVEVLSEDRSEDRKARERELANARHIKAAKKLADFDYEQLGRRIDRCRQPVDPAVRHNEAARRLRAFYDRHIQNIIDRNRRPVLS